MSSPGTIGILAYGSLIADPGMEIEPLIVRRIEATTPFPVEYARLSGTRGGAPTVVPHDSGKTVRAEVLCLAQAISLHEARNLLWRRETRNEGSGKAYKERNSPNAVVIRDQQGFHGVDHVLYTDFDANGKLKFPDAIALARAAIASVVKAPPGKDGISYLMSLMEVGVETTLTPKYMAEILAQAHATSLDDALQQLRRTTARGADDGEG